MNWAPFHVVDAVIQISFDRHFSRKNRKAWFAPACISTMPETMKVRYGSWWNLGRIASTDDDFKRNDDGTHAKM